MAKEVLNVNIPKEDWDIDYDEEADVLYISFGKPQPADESKEVNDIIFRFKGSELVGITVIGFKHRLKRK